MTKILFKLRYSLLSHVFNHPLKGAQNRKYSMVWSEKRIKTSWVGGRVSRPSPDVFFTLVRLRQAPYMKRIADTGAICYNHSLPFMVFLILQFSPYASCFDGAQQRDRVLITGPVCRDRLRPRRGHPFLITYSLHTPLYSPPIPPYV